MTITYRYELVELLKHLGLPLTAVCVGVAEGLFDKDLLDKGLEKLYSVDAWKTLDQTGDGGFPQDWHNKNYIQAKQRLSAFGNKSVILRGVSHEMAKFVPDNSCGAVYLDGDHSELGVTTDLNYWFPKLVKGGIIATHDYFSTAYGTKTAFEKFTKLIGVTDIIIIPENSKENASAYFIKP
jgi:hypothetical protein